MLTLNDGRSELWQWDTGRKLAVDADCSQVHFSNKVFGRSIDVDVADGMAIIPDILLQTDKELTAWAFVGTAENGYTKISRVFKVNKRNKPADYVFTPTEQTTLGELVERLEKIEETQDPDAIKNAVDDYLASNPIQVEETDPTVPDWAKQPTKPKYTAAEVGAIPDTTEIPVVPTKVSAFENDAGYLTEHQDLSGYAKTEDIPTTLPNPNALTFTGAVEGTYDGSAPKEIKIPEGGSGGSTSEAVFETLFDTGSQKFPAGTVDINTGLSLDDLELYDCLVFQALTMADPWTNRNIRVVSTNSTGARYNFLNDVSTELGHIWILERIGTDKLRFKVTANARGNSNLVDVPPSTGNNYFATKIGFGFTRATTEIGSPVETDKPLRFLITGTAPTTDFTMRFAVVGISKRGDS